MQALTGFASVLAQGCCCAWLQNWAGSPFCGGIFRILACSCLHTCKLLPTAAYGIAGAGGPGRLLCLSFDVRCIYCIACMPTDIQSSAFRCQHLSWSVACLSEVSYQVSCSHTIKLCVLKRPGFNKKERVYWSKHFARVPLLTSSQCTLIVAVLAHRQVNMYTHLGITE